MTSFFLLTLSHFWVVTPLFMYVLFPLLLRLNWPDLAGPNSVIHSPPSSPPPPPPLPLSWRFFVDSSDHINLRNFLCCNITLFFHSARGNIISLHFHRHFLLWQSLLLLVSMSIPASHFCSWYINCLDILYVTRVLFFVDRYLHYIPT